MFIKLVCIGKDAELKQSNSGKSFLSLSVVYDIGYGENKQSQWMSHLPNSSGFIFNSLKNP